MLTFIIIGNEIFVQSAPPAPSTGYATVSYLGHLHPRLTYLYSLLLEDWNEMNLNIAKLASVFLARINEHTNGKTSSCNICPDIRILDTQEAKC